MNKSNDMALILPVRGIHPKFEKNCFLAENATIVGEVEMGEVFERTSNNYIKYAKWFK